MAETAQGFIARKVAVVTGAGVGIGRAIAIGLAAEGAKVVVNDLGVKVDGSAPSSGPAEETVAVIRDAGGEAFANTDSVATMEGGRRIIASAIEHFGRIDALFCCAGVLRVASIDDMVEDEWDLVLETHLKGHFATMQPAARAMRAQGSGSIVTFTSTGGLEGNPIQPNYSAAKEGIIGLTRAVALSLAPHVTVNAMAPAAATRMTERLRPGYNPGAPEDLVPLAVFLASDAARHITGQVIWAGGDRISLYPQPRPIRSAVSPGGWTVEQLAQEWDRSLGQDKLYRYDRYIKP